MVHLAKLGLPRLLIAVGIAVGLQATAMAAEPAPTAMLERVVLLVRDRPAVVAFYRDVLGYTEEGTTIGAGPYPEGNPFGFPGGSHIDLTYVKSTDGAYIAVMSTDAKLPDVVQPAGNVAAWNGVTLVHVVKGVDAIYERAKSAGVVIIQPPTLSRSGRSRQFFLRDPVGTRLELNEMLPGKK